MRCFLLITLEGIGQAEIDIRNLLMMCKNRERSILALIFYGAGAKKERSMPASLAAGLPGQPNLRELERKDKINTSEMRAISSPNSLYSQRTAKLVFVLLPFCSVHFAPGSNCG